MQNNQVYFLEQEDFNQVGLEENSFLQESPPPVSQITSKEVTTYSVYMSDGSWKSDKVMSSLQKVLTVRYIFAGDFARLVGSSLYI